VQRVLIWEPDPGLREDLLRVVRGAGYDAEGVADPEAAALRWSGARFDAVVVDVAGPHQLERVGAAARAPSKPAVVVTSARPSLDLAVEAMKRGARDFLRKPFGVDALEGALDQARSGRAGRAAARSGLVAEDPAMLALLREAEAAGASDATVLIEGESGTGKELLARHLHRVSGRRAGPFVVVGCAGLLEEAAGRDLFGELAGAATPARSGLVPSADGGTLLLDEVGETAPALQPGLLRVLQERRVTPLGAPGPQPVDVRVVATTRSDLRAEVEAGRFREDLLTRLDVVSLRVPPLRERRGDVPLLARHLLERVARAAGRPAPVLGERALRELAGLPWRGNVRELENLMRRAVLLFPDGEVDVERLLSRAPAPAAAASGSLGEALNLRELERRAIERSLEECAGNRTRASRVLGISVRTLRNKIRAYGLAGPRPGSPA